MKEKTLVMQHFNAFNQILRDLFTLEVKIKKEDKALLFLFSLLQRYGHLSTAIMYEKETLKLEDIRQMLQNNELIKKTYFTKEALDY